jgi:hypothetical protein
MAAQEKIKVTFKRIYTINDADWFGSGEFYFQATVDGHAAGNPGSTFDAVEGKWFDLPSPDWSAVVDVAGKNQIVVKFHGKDRDLVFDDDLGSVTYTLRRPFTQSNYRHRTEYFVLDWDVELLVDGAYGMHPADAVFACRENPGSINCTTVSGTTFQARMEIHEVRPTPPAADVPPRRPVFPPGTPAAVQNTAATPPISPADPINVIPNPSVIPILTAVEATALTAARIEFSYYRPGTLAFADNDARLVWTVNSIAGGAAVSFVGPAQGTKVMVYGTVAGEVLLEVRFRGALIAKYRALVLAVKKISCRFTILNGPTADSTPRSTPANVADHLAITNRMLRQVAIELVLDTNVSTTDGAVVSATPGIFRARVTRGQTRRIPSTGFTFAARINFRPNVMNFAYIHSESAGNLGAAEDYPASNAGATITDSGTPSSSWLPPSGIPPDGAAGTSTMTLLAARVRPAPPGHPNRWNGLFSMYVSDSNGDPSTLAGQQKYANTMAHEFCHILGLAHRVDGAGSPFNDGINYPPNENLMHFNNGPALAQDLDILQARAVRQSPLVPP